MQCLLQQLIWIHVNLHDVKLKLKTERMGLCYWKWVLLFGVQRTNLLPPQFLQRQKLWRSTFNLANLTTISQFACFFKLMVITRAWNKLISSQDSESYKTTAQTYCKYCEQHKSNYILKLYLRRQHLDFDLDSDSDWAILRVL